MPSLSVTAEALVNSSKTLSMHSKGLYQILSSVFLMSHNSLLTICQGGQIDLLHPEPWGSVECCAFPFYFLIMGSLKYVDDLTLCHPWKTVAKITDTVE